MSLVKERRSVKANLTSGSRSVSEHVCEGKVDIDGKANQKSTNS